MSDGEQERFYYAGGRRVPLQRSRRFVAVRTPIAPGSDGGAAGTSSQDGLAWLTDLGRVLDLAEYGLAVVVLPRERAAANATADSLRAAVEREAGPGPEVYESPESAGVGLIPLPEVLVRFREGVPEATREQVLARRGLTVRRRDYPAPGALLCATESDGDAIAVANRLHEEESVESAEPNFVVLTQPPAAQSMGLTFPMPTPRGEAMPADAPAALAVTPSDPAFSLQWGLAKIKAPDAWDISMGTPSISIAVIDTGATSAMRTWRTDCPATTRTTATMTRPRPRCQTTGTAHAALALPRLRSATAAVAWEWRLCVEFCQFGSRRPWAVPS